MVSAQFDAHICLLNVRTNDQAAGPEQIEHLRVHPIKGVLGPHAWARGGRDGLQPFVAAMTLGNRSIRAYLTHLAAAVALPLVVLEVWNLHAAAEADSEAARDQVLHLARVTASEMVRFLDGVKDIASGLAARPAVRALDPASCDPILKDLLPLAPRFANVVTMDLEGRVICSAVPAAQPARGVPGRFLNRLRGPDQLTVGVAAPGVVTGRWVVPLGVPLVNAKGDVTG